MANFLHMLSLCLQFKTRALILEMMTTTVMRVKDLIKSAKTGEERKLVEKAQCRQQRWEQEVTSNGKKEEGY